LLDPPKSPLKSPGEQDMKTVTERLEDAKALFITKHGIEPSDVFIGYLTEFEMTEELSLPPPVWMSRTLEGSRFRGLLVHVLKDMPVALWVGSVVDGDVVA